MLLLRNKWVGVLGDSVARLFSAALLRAVGDDSIAQPVLDGHRSFQYPLAAPGGRVDFVWAPFAENLTATLQGWREQGQAPDVLILGVSLWHMLHVHDVSAYAASLADVRAELDSIAGEERNARVAMFWMSTTALVTPKLLTAEKRARLTRDQIEAYNHAAADALSLPAGRPCQVLDVHRLTAGVSLPCPAHAGPSRAPSHPGCPLPSLRRPVLGGRHALPQRHVRRAAPAVGQRAALPPPRPGVLAPTLVSRRRGGRVAFRAAVRAPRQPGPLRRAGFELCGAIRMPAMTFDMHELMRMVSTPLSPLNPGP